MRSVGHQESLSELMERCNAGRPIPPVDAADVKACWEFWQRQEEADRQFPGKTPVKAVRVDPPVDAADVKACWEFWQRQEEADRQPPGKTLMKAVGVELIAPYLSPGADVFAVGLRCGFLKIITKFGVLEPWLREGTLDGAVYRAAAEYPFKNGNLDPADFVAPIRTQTDT